MFKTISLLLSFSVIFPSLAYAMDNDDQAPRGQGLPKQQKTAEAPVSSPEDISFEDEITTHRFGFEYLGIKFPMKTYLVKTQRPKPLTEEDIQRENMRKQYIELKERRDFSFDLEMDQHSEFPGFDSEERLAIMKEIIKDHEKRQQNIIDKIKNEYFSWQ